MFKGENTELIPPFNRSLKMNEDLEFGHTMNKIGIKLKGVNGPDGFPPVHLPDRHYSGRDAMLMFNIHKMRKDDSMVYCPLFSFTLICPAQVLLGLLDLLPLRQGT